MRFAPPTQDLTPDLAPSFDSIDRLTRQGVIAPPDPSLAAGSKPRRSTFSQRLAARVRDDAARANVDAGKVHPALYDFLRDARRDFRPDFQVLDDDPRTPNTVGRALGQWGRWLTETGHRQLAEQRSRLRKHHAARRGKPDRLGRDDRALDDVAEAARPISCVACLVIRPDSVPQVVLGSSSDNGELDRAALAALRRAANNRPLELTVKPQRTCYRFQATVFRIPPLPVLGCGPDGNGGITCVYPTKKLVQTSVTLESVDYDG